MRTPVGLMLSTITYYRWSIVEQKLVDMLLVSCLEEVALYWSFVSENCVKMGTIPKSSSLWEASASSRRNLTLLTNRKLGNIDQTYAPY